MKKKILLAILLLLVGVNGVVGLSYYIHGDNGLNGNYINLIPPPPEALASDYGSPLVTVDIGLFAYYEAADWDLNDVIPAFQNYTQYSNYVDGYVRCFNNVRGTTFDGTTYGHTADNPIYIDVQVRVRSDGWIMAWLEDSQNKAFICSWGDYIRRYESEGNPIDAISSPIDYATCLGRAIYRVYHNAGVSWIGYDEIFYYDYEFPDATRLYIFGDFVQAIHPNAEEFTDHFYFIVPNTVTIEEAYIGYAGFTSTGSDDIDIDDVDVSEDLTVSSGCGLKELDISSYLSEGTRHDIKLHQGGAAQGEAVVCWVVMWTS